MAASKPNQTTALGKAVPPRRTARMSTYVREINADLMAEPPVTAETIAPERPFMALPLHIVADILSHLGDVKYLPSALLTHPIFYAAYKDFPTLTSNALRRQISDEHVYVYALIAFESDPSRRAARGTTTFNFLQKYREDPASLIPRRGYVDLHEALGLGEFHSCIVQLRDSFLDQTLRRLYDITDSSQPLPKHVREASPLELRSVERALYRYQIFCNLFADYFNNYDDAVELKGLFFDRHPMWVNEQLGCIYEYLESETRSAMEQAAQKDTKSASWLLGIPGAKLQQRCLSLGLPWLHRLFTASSEDKFSILSEAKELEYSRNVVSSNTATATATLSHPATTTSTSRSSTKPREETTGPGADWTEKVNGIFLDVSSEVTGPESAWNETHSSGNAGMIVTVDHAQALRRLGYVIWDRRRFDTDEPEGQTCRRTFRTARDDHTPIFISVNRLFNPVIMWDPSFRSRKWPDLSNPPNLQREPRRQGGARPFVRRSARGAGPVPAGPAPKSAVTAGGKMDSVISESAGSSSANSETQRLPGGNIPRTEALPTLSVVRNPVVGTPAQAGSTISAQAS